MIAFLVDEEELLLCYIVEILVEGGISIIKILDIIYEIDILHETENRKKGTVLNIVSDLLFTKHSIFHEIFETKWK